MAAIPAMQAAYADGPVAVPPDFSATQTVKVLGKKMSGTMSAGTPEGVSKVQTSAQITVLGKDLQPMQADVTPPTTINGVTYAEFYSFGKRVYSSQFFFTHDGIMSFQAGILPTEVRVPLVKYPIGPVIVGIDGGARFQALAEGQLLPTIVMGSSDSGLFAGNNLSSLEVKLDGNVSVDGFIEGSAKLLFLRAGVGGDLTLVNAEAQADTVFYFDGRHPLTQLGVMAQFLQGKLYSFFDIFNLFQFGWTRMSEHDFYQTKGYCFSKGNLGCPLIW